MALSNTPAMHLVLVMMAGKLVCYDTCMQVKNFCWRLFFSLADDEKMANDTGEMPDRKSNKFHVVFWTGEKICRRLIHSIDNVVVARLKYLCGICSDKRLHCNWRSATKMHGLFWFYSDIFGASWAKLSRKAVKWDGKMYTISRKKICQNCVDRWLLKMKYRLNANDAVSKSIESILGVSVCLSVCF